MHVCRMNDINPDTDIAVKAEDQKNTATKPPESSYVYQGWRDRVLNVVGLIA